MYFSGKIPIFHLGDPLKFEADAYNAVQPRVTAAACETDL
jgi:hypothetical protein